MSNLVPRISSFFNLAATGERTGQNTSRENRLGETSIYHRLGASRKSTCQESKGGFFWENPKTDLWSQIIRILHYQKNGRSEKGSFTMTTACPRAVLVMGSWTNWSSRQRQEEKATKARNEYTKCIYFGLKHKRFSNKIHLRIVRL